MTSYRVELTGVVFTEFYQGVTNGSLVADDLSTDLDGLFLSFYGEEDNGEEGEAQESTHFSKTYRTINTINFKSRSNLLCPPKTGLVS